MIRKILTSISLTTCLVISAQTKFHKGYIINSQNVKIDCLIQNRDWIKSPEKLEYKLSENSVVETINSSDFIAFQLFNTAHYYKKFTVLIDRNTKKESFDIQSKQLFLKVLVEGNASLYQADNNKFFYQKANGEVKQLIFKEFHNKDRNVEHNNSYRTELYNELKCKKDDAITLRKVNYNADDLVDFFIKYNQCVKADFENFNKNRTKWKLDFSVIAGVYFNSYESNTDVVASSVNISKLTSLKSSTTSSNIALGIQLEAFLPFENRRWAIVFSPNYQNLNIDSSKRYDDGVVYEVNVPDQQQRGTNTIITDYLDVEISSRNKYSLLEIPVGVRHYFALNNTSRLFLESSLSLLLNVKPPSEEVVVKNFEPNEATTGVFYSEYNTSSFLKFGAGYSFKRYSLGLNYHPSRKLSNNKGSSFSILASYKIN